METNILKKNGEVIGQIEFYISLKAKTIFIEEIAVFGVHKRSGVGTRAVWKLFQDYNHLFIENVMGMSTDDAIPFWKSLGAEFSDKKKSEDCLFTVNKYTLLSRIRKKMEDSK